MLPGTKSTNSRDDCGGAQQYCDRSCAMRPPRIAPASRSHFTGGDASGSSDTDSESPFEYNWKRIGVGYESRSTLTPSNGT